MNPVLRERVLAVANELGYHPHGLAQALRRGHSRILGLQVAYVTLPTSAVIAEGALDEAYARDYAVAVCVTRGDPRRERTHLEILARQQIAALLVLPVSKDPTPYLQLQERGIPIVFMQRRVPGVAGDLVATDYRDGTMSAVRHLLQQGRRRVALLAPATAYGSNADRVAGYHAAYAELAVAAPDGLTRLDLDTRTPNETYLATRELLSCPEPPDAIIAGSSDVVMPALACLRDLGVAVPQDIAFVGAGDVAWARVAQPPLTMIEIDGRGIGRQAVEMALERLQPEMREAPPREVFVPPCFTVRASSVGSNGGATIRAGVLDVMRAKGPFA